MSIPEDLRPLAWSSGARPEDFVHLFWQHLSKKKRGEVPKNFLRFVIIPLTIRCPIKKNTKSKWSSDFFSENGCRFNLFAEGASRGMGFTLLTACGSWQQKTGTTSRLERWTFKKHGLDCEYSFKVYLIICFASVLFVDSVEYIIYNNRFKQYIAIWTKDLSQRLDPTACLSSTFRSFQASAPKDRTARPRGP